MQIINTKDNSFTLYSDTYKEHYHSINGAVNESNHIYINTGIKSLTLSEVNIFEMGFGTGLNTYLTAIYALKNKIFVNYTTIEKHPLNSSNFLNSIPNSFRNPTFDTIHSSPWGYNNKINKHISLLKIDGDIQKHKHLSKYDLVYYDAFSPESQPELWSTEIFSKLYEAMNTNGILVTYCVKGNVKRILKSIGFYIEKLPGPIGKREILRAIKL